MEKRYFRTYEGVKYILDVENCFAPVWFCYVYSMYTLYSCMPVVINVSSATAVNLSLLTADLYSLFCGLFLFQYTRYFRTYEGVKYILDVENCFAPVWFCYVYSMYTLYSCMPVVINVSSATAVNLSLLTADLYSLFCGLFLFQYTSSISYCWVTVSHYERQVGCEVESQEKSQTDSSGKFGTDVF